MTINQFTVLRVKTQETKGSYILESYWRFLKVNLIV